MNNTRFVSRAGEKLEYAIKNFNIDVEGKTCADFGSSTGGFVDCLLQHGAKKVYAVETGYGLLDWKLRNDPRVVVMEKTNAVYVDLPEKVDLITIDTSWTKQAIILPSAHRNLKTEGIVISLIKPSFESSSLAKVSADAVKAGFSVIDQVQSPILGAKRRDMEYLYLLGKTLQM